MEAGIVQLFRREVTRPWPGVVWWGAETGLPIFATRGSLRAFLALAFQNLVNNISTHN